MADVRTKDGFVEIELDTRSPYNYTESLTAHEAERLIKELRRAIDSLRPSGPTRSWT